MRASPLCALLHIWCGPRGIGKGAREARGTGGMANNRMGDAPRSTLPRNMEKTCVAGDARRAAGSGFTASWPTVQEESAAVVGIPRRGKRSMRGTCDLDGRTDPVRGEDAGSARGAAHQPARRAPRSGPRVMDIARPDLARRGSCVFRSKPVTDSGPNRSPAVGAEQRGTTRWT